MFLGLTIGPGTFAQEQTKALGKFYGPLVSGDWSRSGRFSRRVAAAIFFQFLFGGLQQILAFARTFLGQKRIEANQPFTRLIGMSDFGQIGRAEQR
jgi:hypothetical protein